MSMPKGRAQAFQRNADLEAFLTGVQERLQLSHTEILRTTVPSDDPLVLVIGAPRSGTTLMMQWLASSGCFSFPSNVLSRFFGAPTVGALVHRLLCDPALQHGQELSALQESGGHQSDLGKTKGPAAPHEFWYFWRRFLPTVDIEPLGDAASQADLSGLRHELQTIASLLGRPFCCKGMMVQYDPPLFAEAVPEARFLYVHRDLDANARSLLRARERFFGDRRTWYSARPPGTNGLLGLTPEEQVRQQVMLTEESITDGLASMSSDRWVATSLEGFLANPQRLWGWLRTMLQTSGNSLPAQYPGPPVGPQT